MSAWTEYSRIGKSETKNLLFLSFFDERSFDETLEDIREYGNNTNMHV